MLVTSSNDLGARLGEGGGVTFCPGLRGVVTAVVAGINNVGVVLPNMVICVTGVCLAGPLVGVCQSSRLLAEVGLLEFLLRLA